MVEIREVDPASDLLRPMIAAHLAHSRASGPAESNHTLDTDSLRDPGMRFWALFENDQALACGALKTLSEGLAEVKSVHVLAAARGRGLAQLMMEHIATCARTAGARALVLETGSARLAGYDAARNLYERLGYSYCGPFEGYDDDPNSAFMRLDLAPAHSQSQSNI